MQDLIEEIEQAAEALGVRPTTLCKYALGDWRAYARTKKLAKRVDNDRKRVSAYVKEQTKASSTQVAAE